MSYIFHSGQAPSAASAAAAKSLQSCLRLCDPIDGSPPGSAVPRILQARTLEWVAISFSNAWKWKVKVKSLSRVRLLATPWTAAHQAPLSLGKKQKRKKRSFLSAMLLLCVFSYCIHWSKLEKMARSCFCLWNPKALWPKNGPVAHWSGDVSGLKDLLKYAKTKFLNWKWY